MSLKRQLGKLCLPAIASLYICALMFLLPGILRNLDRPEVRSAKSNGLPGTSHFAIADFDGDLQPDLATIRVTRDSSRQAQYFLELRLSSGSRPPIGILGPAGGLQITPQDVNGDKITDLVVTSPLDAKFVAILVNDGKGNFRQVEAEDYPEAGKRSGSRFLSTAGLAEPELSLEQKRGMDSQGVFHGGGERLIEEGSQLRRPTAIASRSFPLLACAGRAPPFV